MAVRPNPSSHARKSGKRPAAYRPPTNAPLWRYVAFLVPVQLSPPRRALARAYGGHGLQTRLHARGQQCFVGRVNNGRAELVAQGDAETAAGQLRIDVERGNLHLGQVCAGQCAVKAHQVGVGAIGSDDDLVTQSGMLHASL